MPLSGTAFERTLSEQLAQHLKCKPAMTKLNTLAMESAGISLVVLIRIDHRMVELHPAGDPENLPAFCKVYRASASGKTQCLTCRSLVAFGACYRGLIEYACHGGIIVIASPALRVDGTTSDRFVIAGCAFARLMREKGWRLTAKHGTELGLDLARLKQAYFSLPALTEERCRLARGIVEAAAAVLGEIEETISSDYATGHSAGENKAVDAEKEWRDLAPALAYARDKSLKRAGAPAGAALVDLVAAMVRRDPTMDFSVRNIARAARITPNHFSTLFHKHTGQMFRDFLTQERISFSCSLLRDPTLSVIEVARRVGFEDPAYFSRRFKQIIGISPTQWRNLRNRTTEPNP